MCAVLVVSVSVVWLPADPVCVVDDVEVVLPHPDALVHPVRHAQPVERVSRQETEQGSLGDRKIRTYGFAIMLI